MAISFQETCFKNRELCSIFRNLSETGIKRMHMRNSVSYGRARHGWISRGSALQSDHELFTNRYIRKNNHIKETADDGAEYWVLGKITRR